MVDKSRRVDVDGSLKEREWSTEEFYAVLNQHTEQVGVCDDEVGGLGGRVCMLSE